jgi:hypothetical protein
MNSIPPLSKRKIPLGDFRRLIVDEIGRLLVDARRAQELGAGSGFVRRDPTLIIVRSSTQEAVEAVARFGAALAEEFPALADTVSEADRLAVAARDAQDGAEAVRVWTQVMNLFYVAQEDSGDNFVLQPEANAVVVAAIELSPHPDGVSADAVESIRDDQAFIAATMNVISAARAAGRSLTRDEQASVAASFRLLERGVQLPPGYRGIGTYGFRRYQTSLSAANPGDGHISATCTSSDMLQGTVVHIEHIDRDNISDREVMEPYRLPAALNAARVRLHVGSATPCTAYIGRPVFENGTERRGEVLRARQFRTDLLKSVHIAASSATVMFINGVADCKFAIERMSAQEAVEFLRAVSGNVMRNASDQYLSAAFNIRLPFLDDFADVPVLQTERLAIAKLGIEIAVRGRFDKVTWDGAGNEQPSTPIVEQMPFSDWVDLIHEAHERGLETYVSAGMKASHIRECVYIGVDGAGIGTSLHHRHPETKALGQLKPEAIREVLQVRNEAAMESLGRGAAMLARFDRLFFEGTLMEDREELRSALHQAQRARNAEEVEKLLVQCAPPTEAAAMLQQDEATNAVIGHAMRIVKTAGMPTIGAKRFGSQVWTKHTENVRRLLEAGDVTALRQSLL